MDVIYELEDGEVSGSYSCFTGGSCAVRGYAVKIGNQQYQSTKHH
jgi:hypothetical protein